MSTLEKIYLKMNPESGDESMAFRSETESSRTMGREVAHELNNVLTIIQGYAERMVIKHGSNPALCADLRLILDNARRASNIVRQSRPQNPPKPPLVG
jgi:nitrogen-specific signal transduction histidine kinase